MSLSDGRTLYGELVGVDSEVDQALLQVAAGRLAAARFSDPGHLKQGDSLIVVGYECRD